MATLTGQPVATTFKDLLQMGNSGAGLTGTTRTVQDGDGTNSPLQLSSDAVNMNGTFQLNGVTLTASAARLNNTIVGTGGVSVDNSIVTYDGIISQFKFHFRYFSDGNFICHCLA